MGQVSDKAVVFLPWATIEPEAQKQILNTARRVAGSNLARGATF